MMTMTQKIKAIIEKMLLKKCGGGCIIYPFGDIGMSVKNILNIAYGITEDYVVDDSLCRYNTKIYSTGLFDEIEIEKYSVILATDKKDLYDELVEKLLAKKFDRSQIFTFECNITGYGLEYYYSQFVTKIGKYSYGPICVEHHPYIEEIGAFCCFAYGVEVVGNHEMKYITTHDILYGGKQFMGIDIPYECYRGKACFLEGIAPKDCVTKRKRNKIGNDVWLGRNVIITNGANIGNGVIAGAGAVITKDVPDYAVVAGVPAKIIKYRYTQDQIEALNRIQWWSWTDDKIRNCYDDFYLPVEKFIEKHDERVEQHSITYIAGI